MIEQISKLADDCIRINMEIITNSTRQLAQPGHDNANIIYFRHAIEYSKQDIKQINELKKKWKQSSESQDTTN